MGHVFDLETPTHWFVADGLIVHNSKDGYILDGHHRWAAQIAQSHLQGSGGHAAIPVHEVGMEIGAALDFTRAYTNQMGVRQMGVGQFRAALLRLSFLPTVRPSRPGFAVPRVRSEQGVETVTEAFRNAVTDVFADWDESAHPRDDHGRFGDGLGIPTGPPRQIRLEATVPVPPRTDPHVRGQAVEKITGDLVAQRQDTESVYDKIDGKIGKYTAERAALHDEIVSQALQKAIDGGAQKGTDAVMMGGLPAAGKSYSVEHAFDTSHFVNINPDDMKAALIEHNMNPQIDGFGAMETGPLMHEESSHLSSMLADRAMSQGYNVLYDITMGAPKGVEKRLGLLDENGYKTTGVFVDVPPAFSAQQVVDRYARALVDQPNLARYVPSDQIKSSGNHTDGYLSNNRAVFEQEKSRFSGWAVYARDENTPMHLVEQSSPDALAHLRDT